jgi:protein-tyrosine-phosphatase
MLHPARRRRGLGIVAQVAPQRLLFLCHGNICRSPYAAHAVRALLPEGLRERVSVESAGFVGPDRPPPAEALKAALARGVDLGAHRSKLVTREQIERADLVVVMDGSQPSRLRQESPALRAPVVMLGDLDPDRRQRRSIQDPIGMTLAVFERTFDRLDRCLRELAAAMASAGPAPIAPGEVPFAVPDPPRKYA